MKTFLLLFLAASAAFSDVRVTTARAGLRPSGYQKQSRARATFVESDTLHVIPYILDGNGFSTQLIFTSLEDHDVKANCGFYGPDGSPIDLAFSSGAGSGLDIDFAAYGSTTATIRGGGTRLTTAWAWCSSDGDTDRFTIQTVIRSESGTTARDFTIPFVSDDERKSTVPLMAPATYQTGIVLINTANEQSASLKLSLMNGSGKLLGFSEVSLKPGELTVFVATTVFRPLIAVTNLSEYTVVTEQVDGSPWITTMALRAGGTGGTIAFPSQVVSRYVP